MNFEYTDSKKMSTNLLRRLMIRWQPISSHTLVASQHILELEIFFSAIENYCKNSYSIPADDYVEKFERGSRLVINFICKSHKQPLGPVDRIWYRYEFQEKTAGFPHIHALIWTKEDPFSNCVQERVCCSLPTFLFKLPISYQISLQKKIKLKSENCSANIKHTIASMLISGEFRCHKQNR